MRSFKAILSRLVLVGAILALAGCSKNYRNHGYVPTEDELASVLVGVDTRETVEAAIGSPTSSGVVRDTAWYYVGSRWEHFAYREARAIDRQVVAISFDTRGSVENIERFTLEDGRVVALSRRVTDSNIKGISFVRQLLGSIGQFNAGELLGG